MFYSQSRLSDFGSPKQECLGVNTRGAKTDHGLGGVAGEEAITIQGTDHRRHITNNDMQLKSVPKE